MRVLALDTEYSQGDRPGDITPVAVTLTDTATRTTRQYWQDELATYPPSPHRPGDIVIVYNAMAEASFYRAMGWARPDAVIDLWAEFKMWRHRNRPPKEGYDLGGCLQHFGLSHPLEDIKNHLQTRIWRGAPWAAGEREMVLHYNFVDVDVMLPLLARFRRILSWPVGTPPPKSAALRGLYMWVLDRVQSAGIPVDAPLMTEFLTRWQSVRPSVLRALDIYGFLDDHFTLKQDRVNQWVQRSGIVGWPRTEKKRDYSLEDDRLEELEKLDSRIRPIRDLLFLKRGGNVTLLAPDADARQRPKIWPWESKTGRNQPKAREHIYLANKAFRHFICPPPGRALIYGDQSAQEMAVAASLSGDRRLIDCYTRPPDGYINLAVELDLAPVGTSKEDPVRDRMKVFNLATLYGGGIRSLGAALQEPSRRRIVEVRNRHRQRFSRFWQWSDRVVFEARYTHRLRSPLGWTLYDAHREDYPTLRNWMVQATGADLMRGITIAMVDAGLQVCALVHDGFLVECAVDEIESTTATMDSLMRGVSRAVLGLEIRNKFDVILPGQHYLEPRGRRLWEAIWTALGRDSAPGYEADYEAGASTGNSRCTNGGCTLTSYRSVLLEIERGVDP